MRRFYALLILGVIGCSGDPVDRYVDPEVDYQDTPGYEVTGDPIIDLGHYEEQLFTPFVDGDDAFIIHGFQGGTWLHASIRYQGLADETRVKATVIAETGEQIGVVDTVHRFVLSTDGWLEIQVLPVPIKHAPPNEQDPIDDLYDLDAEFAVTLTDDAGRTITTTRDLHLLEG